MNLFFGALLLLCALGALMLAFAAAMNGALLPAFFAVILAAAVGGFGYEVLGWEDI